MSTSPSDQNGGATAPGLSYFSQQWMRDVIHSAVQHDELSPGDIVSDGMWRVKLYAYNDRTSCVIH